MTAGAQFAHRQNGDGTIDSICLHCFQTVATGDSNAALVLQEAAHQCSHRGSHRDAPAHQKVEPQPSNLRVFPDRFKQ